MKLAIAFLLAVTTCLAQTTGTINGSVRDESGAVIPGAKVGIRGLASGDRRTAATNDRGAYAFPFLAPGEYEVEFSRPGFTTVAVKATLNITDVVAIDAVLRPSAVAERIEVTAASPLLQTESASLGRVVDGNAVKELPLSSRNFTQLLALSPGTSGPLNDAGALGRGTQNISSGGARLGSNSVYIDGVDSVNIHSNTSNENAFASNGLVAPSPEAIQEFKVQTGLYDATSGRSGGAAVVLVTRSGTPQFHGTLFEFFRNNALNANSYFFNSTGQARPVLKQNQFGGNIGGPVVRNKTFFFFSYQGTRQRNGLSGSSSLTLPNIPLDRSRVSLGRVFTGLRGTRGGPAILADGSNINPVAVALLNTKLPNNSFVIPSPQTSGAGVNFSASIPARYQEHQYISNVDHQINSNNRLTFKSIISAQPAFQSMPAANVPGFGTTQDFKSRILSLTDTHIFTPNLVNEARMGISRLVGVVVPETQIPLTAIGMRRFNSADFNDIPQITVTGAFSIGYSVNSDQGVAQNTFHWVDTLSWTRASTSSAPAWKRAATRTTTIPITGCEGQCPCKVSATSSLDFRAPPSPMAATAPVSAISTAPASPAASPNERTASPIWRYLFKTIGRLLHALPSMSACAGNISVTPSINTGATAVSTRVCISRPRPMASLPRDLCRRRVLKNRCLACRKFHPR
ncbi:MAG: hypothetical protein EXQ57_04575 [Bryobacterales bacterium]|nr:hypothetical protein [Bryobacterales bacterium]